LIEKYPPKKGGERKKKSNQLRSQRSNVIMGEKNGQGKTKSLRHQTKTSETDNTRRTGQRKPE